MDLSRRLFLGTLGALVASPAIIRLITLMPVRVVPVRLLNPADEDLISWMGGLFDIPTKALGKEPELFQTLCGLYGDPTGRFLRPGNVPVFNEDYTLNERATLRRARGTVPSSMALRGRST